MSLVPIPGGVDVDDGAQAPELERGHAESIADPAPPPHRGGGGAPPDRPPMEPPRGPRRPERPERPPLWRRLLLWAGMLAIAWIVGAALGMLIVRVEAGWERRAP